MTEPAYTEPDLRIAKEWVYKVHAWRGRSPEFMVGQSERLAAEFARIRSEARAGMREACAGHLEADGGLDAKEWAAEIRKLPDTAADEAIERIKAEAERKGRLYANTEVELLRGKLHTIGMSGEFGPTNSQVAIRLRELESREDQCRQYIQHAQEREHEINVLRERIKREARLESEAQRVIELIENECGPDIAWNLGKITNDRWFGHPYGRGYTVILNVSNSDRAIFEKRGTLMEAAEKAIARAKERIAELSGKES